MGQKGPIITMVSIVEPHIRCSFNPVPLYSTPTETNSRRSRPSFVDSLIGSRASSGTPFKQDELEENETAWI